MVNNVYVDNKYRNMGIIYNIMESGVENSHELKFDRLYFYIRYSGLYEKFGWNLLRNLKLILVRCV